MNIQVGDRPGLYNSFYSTTQTLDFNAVISDFKVWKKEVPGGKFDEYVFNKGWDGGDESIDWMDTGVTNTYSDTSWPGTIISGAWHDVSCLEKMNVVCSTGHS